MSSVAVPRTQPPPGVTYPLALGGDGGEMRSLVGVLLGVSAFIIVVPVVNQLIVWVSWLVLGRNGTFAAFFASARAFEHPAGLIGAHLGLATLIPVTMALVVYWHGRSSDWLMSVQPGMRWRYLLLAVIAAAVVLNAVAFLSTAALRTATVTPQASFWTFLVVIVLTSPLQAVGEEFLFRGYLLATLGTAFRNTWVGVVGSALVFAVFHGTQNLPLFVDRFAFGLLAAWLVVRTGGLEAGIAAHVVNNICAFVYASLFGTVAQARAVSGIGWTEALYDVLGFAIFARIAVLLARLMNLESRTPGASSDRLRVGRTRRV